MGALSMEVSKPVAVLVDRRGRVVTVAVGDAEATPIPPWHGERGSRLYGLRLIHTHLKPGGLSGADLTKLFLNHLDAIVAVDIDRNDRGDTILGNAHVATMAPPTSQEEDWIIDPPSSLREVEQVDFLERLRALEEELARARGPREVQRSSEERAVLIGLDTDEGAFEAESRLEELGELVRSAGGVVAHGELQHRKRIDARTLVGRGKLNELISTAFHEDADLLVFDRELSPAQAREIESLTQLKVLDRTQVILDIFAQNARGREAQVQVELAQLHYQLPRLSGRGLALSRLAGGIGTRGPGETKLEVDRRRIRDRIVSLEAAVDEISRRRARTRRNRTMSSTPVIALVGYTNAGKSTLFNALAKADARTRNQLFATLRPTTREGWLPELGEWGSKVLYTDTVGFIRDLPAELINAFRATLEALHDANLLIHVVDGAMPGAPDRIDAVNRILDELKLEPPRLIAINKADAADGAVAAQLEERFQGLSVSARTASGLDRLKGELAVRLSRPRSEGLPNPAEGATGQRHRRSERHH